MQSLIYRLAARAGRGHERLLILLSSRDRRAVRRLVRENAQLRYLLDVLRERRPS